MALTNWVLAALLALPVSKHDRAVNQEEKRAQLVTIAEAISDASTSARAWHGSPEELAALLIAVGYHESAFALHIHAGNCRPGECDGGRARGLWQQQVRSTTSHDAWLGIVGLDAEATRFAARQAARALVRARGACRRLEVNGADWAEMTVTSYAGRGCLSPFSGAKLRVSSFRRILRLQWDRR